ncbi:hypothetical protein RAS1_03780 [Phycisphaerae bacterium RAS1]|nr:hypothetical protein RAS1_03780 [Phycisphaerae bacterium RAS1]
MKRLSWTCVAGALWAVVGTSPAAEYYVNAGNMAENPTGTQQNPFRTVQAGIDAAADGDEVRVAGGTYTENLRVERKAIALLGGYGGDWSRDIAANQTTLAGAGGNAVINIIECDATVDGFRITGGTGSTEGLPYSYLGGGIYSRDGSPTITNNIIEDNDIRSAEPPADESRGGGVFVTNAPAATIMDNVIRGNYAGRGAGIAVFGQAALIQGNTVEDNTSVGDHGGGMYVGVVDATITQNIIRGNEVGRALGYGWGGGLIVFNPGNSAELSFNVVYENFASGYGAGEFIDEGATAVIHHELIFRNISKEGCEAVSALSVDGGEGVGSRATISFCTIAGNVCENAIRGNGIQVEGMSEVSVTNCIFWDNGGDDFAVVPDSTLAVSYTCSEEAIAGTGNIQMNPRFVDAGSDDYHLAADSPCIDAADPAAPFDQEPADNGGRADMGRYGNASDAPPDDNGNGNDNDNGNSNGNDNDNGNENSNGNGNGNDNDNGNANDNDNENGNANENDNGNGNLNDNDNRNDNTDNVNENSGGDGDGDISSGAMCPATATMLFSITLVGAGRMRRRSGSAAADRSGRR